MAAEVRAALARHRKTQSDLAKALGVNDHTIGRRMRGEKAFDVVELQAIAAWLGIAVESLWPDNPDKAAS